MTAVYPCECKHPKPRHQGGTYWCLTPDCACKRYTPDFRADARKAVEAAYEAGDSVLGESTSVRLRRVEAECDELRAALDNLPCGDCWGLGIIPAEAFGRDADGAPERDEEAPCPEGCEIPAWLRAERNDAADDARLLAEAKRERDEALANADRMAKDHIKLLDRNILVEAELASARTELSGLRAANDQLRADYLAAAEELEQLRHCPAEEES